MLLAESVTDHVTVVVPIGKLAGASFVTEATVQLSPVIGRPKATPEAVHKFKSVVTVTFAGGVFKGAIVSETVIVSQKLYSLQHLLLSILSV